MGRHVKLLTMGGERTSKSESMEAEFDCVLKRLKTLVLKSGTDRISGGKRIRESESVEEAKFDHVRKRPKTLDLKSGSTDRISQLPDDILHKILSFFPQESLGKTLFLSKRWLNLWTTLPFLCFKFNSETETNIGLLNFVEKVLVARDKSTFIEKFCLSSSRPDTDRYLDVARVNGLIREAVLRHGVRELDLKLEHTRAQFISPFHVACNSLTSLKLWFDISSKRNFPVSFSFPNLKTMELTYVILGSNIASQLSNNCRKLENLAIGKCCFELIPYNDPNSLRTLPNLFKASLSVVCLYEECAVDFLPVISNVEVLSLKIDFPELFLDELEKIDYFSKFHNLKSLEFGRFKNRKTRVNVIESLLRSSPALESLSIDYFWYNGASEDGSGLIPSCRLSERLKVMKMEGISPPKLLVNLVKYFLEEAKGLEKIIVCKPPKSCCNQVDRDDICQKLQALPNSGALELCEDDTCGMGLYLF